MFREIGRRVRETDGERQRQRENVFVHVRVVLLQSGIL